MVRLRKPPKKPLTEGQKSKFIKMKMYEKGQNAYIELAVKTSHCSCHKVNIKDAKFEFLIFFKNILEKFDRTTVKTGTVAKSFEEYILKRIRSVNYEYSR